MLVATLDAPLSDAAWHRGVIYRYPRHDWQLVPAVGDAHPHIEQGQTKATVTSSQSNVLWP